MRTEVARKVDRCPMRQVAHFCVTLRHSCDRKDAEIAAFRPLFGPKSGLNRRGPGRSGRAFAPKAERHRFGANHPADLVPPRLSLRHGPATSPRPPASPCRPAIRGDGFPRSHGPAKDIVNHQRVNAWLTLLRATAAGADGKFGGISGADEALPERLDRRPMRQVAHICVTLRHSRNRKDTEIAAFRPLFGRKSVVESPKWRKSLPAQRFRPSLQMLQKCRIVAHRCPIARRPKMSVSSQEIRRNCENSPARHPEKSAKCLKSRQNSFSLPWVRSPPQA